MNSAPECVRLEIQGQQVENSRSHTAKKFEEVENSSQISRNVTSSPPEHGTPGLVPVPQGVFRYKGMFLAFLSSFIFSLSAMLVKFLKSYHPVTIALWRFQGALYPSLFLLAKRIYQERSSNEKPESSNPGGKPSVLFNIYPPNNRRNLRFLILALIRSILTCNALLLQFYSLKYLEIGDALVITSSTPVFVTLFAHFFLGEKCGVVSIVCAIATVLGVIVIAKPPHLFGEEEFDSKTILGTILALSCMLVATASYLVLRYIRKVHHLVTSFLFGGWGTLENLILALILGVLSWPKCYKDWLAATALASLTFVGQMAIIKAMQYEKAGPVSLVRTCDVIFAFFWQICVFDCWPEIYSWIGCSIVMFSLIVTASRKWVDSLEPDDLNRKRFFFLLL